MVAHGIVSVVATVVSLAALNAPVRAQDEPTLPAGASADIRAAEAGDADAQYRLGVMYEFGLEVPQDEAEAVAWYRLAAEQGHATAQYDLGFSYANGLGECERNLVEN